MTADPAPRHAVIIPHFNDVTRLARCLAALETQDRDGVEVVVADNNSTADLSEIRARFGWARIVIQPEPGAGLARNLGVAQTTAPWLFFIDSDCLPAPDWLAQAKRIAAGDPRAVTGGRVDVFDETPPPRSGAEAFETVFAFKMERYLREEAFLGAGNLVVSRAVFEATGGFRGAVSEDVDWSRRAAATGFRLAYDDALAAGHPSRSDWPALARKWRRTTQEAYLLRRAEGRGQGGWLLKALAMPFSALVHAPQLLRDGRLGATERLSGLATLVRLRVARMVWMLRLAMGRDLP